MTVKTKITAKQEYLRDLRCEGKMAYKCKIFVAVTYTSWALFFCIGRHVCTLSKVIFINKEREICLPNKKYLSGHILMELIWLPNA